MNNPKMTISDSSSDANSERSGITEATERPRSFLDEAISRLMEVTKRMDQCSETVIGSVDRLIGNRPDKVAGTTAQDADVPAGLYGYLRDAIEDLEASTKSLETAASYSRSL